MPDTNSTEIVMSGGALSTSQIPRIELIPTEAITRLATRFGLGEERKKDKAWNANSDNQAAIMDREFILARIGHVIYHALKLRDKVVRGEDPLLVDDDAGAIIWGGAFLCEVTKRMHEGEVTVR